MDAGHIDHSPAEGACGASRCKLSVGPELDAVNRSFLSLASSARPLISIGPEYDGTLTHGVFARRAPFSSGTRSKLKVASSSCVAFQVNAKYTGPVPNHSEPPKMWSWLGTVPRLPMLILQVPSAGL